MVVLMLNSLKTGSNTTWLEGSLDTRSNQLHLHGAAVTESKVGPFSRCIRRFVERMGPRAASNASDRPLEGKIAPETDRRYLL